MDPTQDLRKALLFRKSYNINDYNWSLRSDRADETVPVDKVQKIKFYEFQPKLIIDIGQLIDGGVNAILKLLPTGSQTAAGKALFDILQGVAAAGAAPAIEELLMQDFLATPTEPFEESLNYIKNLFPGDFLYTYEFPYYDSQQIEADTTAGWSTLGSRRMIGSQAAEIVKKGFNVDFPTTPQWSLSDQRGNNFGFSFDLINDTSANTARNWNMLNSFVAGCFWIQLKQTQKSANIFRVELAGRWEKFWCAVGIKAETQGRLFVDTVAASQLKGVNSNVRNSIRFPEAWKVSLTIIDLVQSNYNVFGNYIINGPTVSTASIGRVQKSIEDLKRESQEIVKSVVRLAK